jgi:hypothetical protein
VNSFRIRIAVLTTVLMATLVGAAFGAMQKVEPSPAVLGSFGSTTSSGVLVHRVRPLYVERTVRTSYKLHRVACARGDGTSVCYAATAS